jgi:hypothetical protein
LGTRLRRKPRILLFTDSRGELKPTFRDKLIFPEKVKAELETRGTKVDLILCPFKWTSTIDFIELVETGQLNIDRHDRIVLYTGVVDWSPRPVSSYRACMKGTTKAPLDLKTLKRTKRPPRLANQKMAFFRQFFGTRAYNAHARSTFNVEYRGEPTTNLYSLQMLETRVIPYLQGLGERLIFINSNRLVPGWEGDYIAKNPDGRPKNIRVLEEYAEKMSEAFDCIDLLKWSERQVKKLTVDNMHLTHAGSEWIYERLMNRLS